MSYTSSSLAGIQAAVAAGLGLSILSEMAIQADHRVLTAKDGFAPIDKTEVALVASPEASPATLRLADRLAEFCRHGAGEGGVAPLSPRVVAVTSWNVVFEFQTARRYTSAFSRRDTPEACIGYTLLQNRGRRESRVPIAPAVVRTRSARVDHRLNRIVPAFPARVGYGLLPRSRAGWMIMAVCARAQPSAPTGSTRIS